MIASEPLPPQMVALPRLAPRMSSPDEPVTTSASFVNSPFPGCAKTPGPVTPAKLSVLAPEFKRLLYLVRAVTDPVIVIDLSPDSFSKLAAILTSLLAVAKKFSIPLMLEISSRDRKRLVGPHPLT